MMTPLEASAHIGSQLPQLRKELQQQKKNDLYHSIQTLTDYTRRMAIEHNFGMVEKCMLLVEQLYKKGNALVKNAVENVFIFSLSSIINFCNIIEWKIIQSYMPSCLYALYIRQVMEA